MDYILITGGQMQNKGAQAMTFIAVDEMKKRYPDCEPVMLSNLPLSKDDKEGYAFTIMPAPSLKTKIAFLYPVLGKLLHVDTKSEYVSQIKHVYANLRGVVDVSGFAISSKWVPIYSISLMMNVALADKYNAPTYLMPQSFGPFEYKGRFATIANWVNKRYLSKCKIVFAREQDGMDQLIKKYRLTNVRVKEDLVLQNKELNLKHIYREVPSFFELSVAPGSVALVPNSKNFVHGKGQDMMGIYASFIKVLLSLGKQVYLLNHSGEDFQICKQLKEMFTDRDDVILVEHELNCIEYSRNVNKFDYIVASRYHSIVIAYRKCVPAIILGWAIKYRDLARMFEQQRFQFDISDADVAAKATKAIFTMNESYSEESSRVQRHLDELQENVFNQVQF